ncbi:peptide-methionine (S)-S-oxide reductase [Hypnocyclicus thermotrophus]|uniref:Peptide methionine sulfoxide reductase MsrA n=1 Tax=Hypnocyclicus thermotrophus TaxID=1627895 RepID=A0AA46E181_9FUSO|nr:peptide-methionine (S)-S-oxide reductase MsrA [Hypnocyclicus thermotrophus]TDT72587.1 peptide-methionine (S)-S-oxide reductase [Hypnocyclicus thermotrophus]
MEKIILAGGCFWGVEAYFKRLKGVIKTKVGYAGGNKKNPTYEEVCSGKTGHLEAVYIEYDRKIINLEKILRHYFDIIDPFSIDRQGGDVGPQYATAIFYNNKEQYDIIRKMIQEIENNFNKKVATKILKESNFFEAEDYHQNYLEKNPTGYCHINLNSIKNSKDYQEPV